MLTYIHRPPGITFKEGEYVVKINIKIILTLYLNKKCNRVSKE